jgi:hypothetical protein
MARLRSLASAAGIGSAASLSLLSRIVLSPKKILRTTQALVNGIASPAIAESTTSSTIPQTESTLAMNFEEVAVVVG